MSKSTALNSEPDSARIRRVVHARDSTVTDDRHSDSTFDTDFTPGTASGLALDTVFELMANQQRRFALYTLSSAKNGVVAFDTLVEEVATLEAALTGDALTRYGYQDVAADLHQWHLPVLADVGVTDYDDRSGTIRYRSHPTLETWVSRARCDEVVPP